MQLSPEQIEKFRTIIKESGLKAPMGNYAVRGNVELNGWPAIFQGLPVSANDDRTRYDLGSMIVTGLSFHDSFNPELHIPSEKKFHIIVGHGPDFALARPDADLLVAGHCHGGQVQLPGIGPLVTLSRVPKKWAAGKTELPAGSLLVSRGIGMERRYAPRLRFLCRPELMFITLVPSAAGKQDSAEPAK